MLDISKYKEVVFFGDSLSDNGNLYRSIEVIPKSPPYWQGRFSNGPTWAELLGQQLKKDNKDLEIHNYAVGGATILLQSPLQGALLYCLASEIDLYISNKPTSRYNYDFSKSLFFIWAGANDYLNDTTTSIDELTFNTKQALRDQIHRLLLLGARDIMVINLPNISKSPYGQSLSPVLQDRLERLCIAHNANIETILYSVLDANVFFNMVLTNTAEYNRMYGTNTTILDKPCWGGKFY